MPEVTSNPMQHNLHGRRVILSDEVEVTDQNLLDILSSAMVTHMQNRAEIEYLYNYYKGIQPILGKTNPYRDDINNIVVENVANEITSFKVGYLLGEPMQYVNRGSSEDEKVVSGIEKLNEYMFAEEKAPKDIELSTWAHICGTSYRMILPDPERPVDEAPFEIYTLDPRNTFVVYSNAIGNPPLMGVRYVLQKDGATVYSIYSRNRIWTIRYAGLINSPLADPVALPTVPQGTTGEVMERLDHIFGGVPIIEYPFNMARLGCFEIVLDLLDGMNAVTSDRIDAVDNYVKSLLLLKGVDIEEDEFLRLKALGGLCVPPEGDAKFLSPEMNQGYAQSLVDDLYERVLLICGLPNRNGGSSTSDTGSAVIMRDGWSDAEARARDSEMIFKRSEKQLLKFAIEYINTLRDMQLKVSDVEIRFTRRNYENIQMKSQVLISMLQQDKIHPRLAFEHSGLFTDPDLAYTQSLEYYEQHRKEMLKDLEDYSKQKTQESTQDEEE